MKLLIRILVTSALVLLIANLMTGVTVAGFALIVALVLGFQYFYQTYFSYTHIPVTLLLLGFFLLVINALLLCDKIVGGFSVDSFFTHYYLVLFIIVTVGTLCDFR
jgi:putative membrane protein